MMGAIEQGGKVAGGIVEALKNQPVVLALVIINVLFMAAAVWLFSGSSVRKDELITELARTVATCQCPPAKH
jgi:hypothetical protein